MAMLAPWQVHSPNTCTKLSTSGATLGMADNYSNLVNLCRRDDRLSTLTVTSR